MTHRRYLKRKFLDLENAIRHSLAPQRFAQAAREAVAGDALVSKLIDAMLNARRALEHGITIRDLAD